MVRTKNLAYEWSLALSHFTLSRRYYNKPENMIIYALGSCSKFTRLKDKEVESAKYIFQFFL
jgi:hypothetical protein